MLTRALCRGLGREAPPGEPQIAHCPRARRQCCRCLPAPPPARRRRRPGALPAVLRAACVSPAGHVCSPCPACQRRSRAPAYLPSRRRVPHVAARSSQPNRGLTPSRARPCSSAGCAHLSEREGSAAARCAGGRAESPSPLRASLSKERSRN